MSSVSLKFSNPIETLSRDSAREWALDRASVLARHSQFLLPSAHFSGEEFLIDLLKKHSSIGIFASQKNWFEASDLENWLLKRCPQHHSSKSFSYPQTIQNPDQEPKMVFRTCSEKDLVSHNHFKGLQDAPMSAPIANPSLIFVPCTLADYAGNRMGRGKGYYDRYISKNPNIYRIGLIHPEFILQSFPKSWIQNHDQGLDALLTTQEFIPIISISTKETSK